MTNRHFLRCVLALLLAAVVFVCIGRFTDIDLRLADAVFDFAANDFPLRENWFFANFMHLGMKALFIGIGMVPAVLLVADTVSGKTLFEGKIRERLWVVVASSILVPAAISAVKGMSIHHCPWSLQRYGSLAPYLRIFDSLPPGVTAGHCFPAGHASTALWLASVAVFWLPEEPWKALIAFAIGLLPGIALGWAQQMRGAHFFTHTLWSVWISSLIILSVSKLLLKSPAKSLSSDLACSSR